MLVFLLVLVVYWLLLLVVFYYLLSLFFSLLWLFVLCFWCFCVAVFVILLFPLYVYFIISELLNRYSSLFFFNLQIFKIELWSCIS